MVLKLQKSACGLSLRDGSLSIAFAFMVGMCSGLVGYIAYLKGRLYDELLTEEECFFLYLEITILVVLLIFNMLLVIGVVLENTGILLAWVTAHALYAFFIISKFTSSFYDAVVKVELLYCVGVLVFYLSILWLVLYSIMVVYSYRALIKSAEICPCLEEEKLRLRDYDGDEDTRGTKKLTMDSRLYGEQEESPVQSLKNSSEMRPPPISPPPGSPPPFRSPSLRSRASPAEQLPTQTQAPQPPPPRRQGSSSSQPTVAQPAQPSVQMTWRKQSIAPSTPSLQLRPSPPEATGASRNASLTHTAPMAAGMTEIQSYQMLQAGGPASPTRSRAGMAVPVSYQHRRSLPPADSSMQLLNAAPTRKTGDQPTPWKLAIMNPMAPAPAPLVRPATGPMTPAKPWKPTPLLKKPVASQEPPPHDPSKRESASVPCPAFDDQQPPGGRSSNPRKATAPRPSPNQPRKARLARDASRLSARSNDLRDMAPTRGSGKPPKQRTSTTGLPRTSGGSGPFLVYASQPSGQARPMRHTPPDTETDSARRINVQEGVMSSPSAKTQLFATTTTSGTTTSGTRVGAGGSQRGPDPHVFGSDAGFGRLWRSRHERAKLRRSPGRK